ncbi:MAG TPA: hypothetical protein VLJ80_12235 [Solirubrobacteraceae bacterium]|nr:hypothetical protein [Solirubrobacteraceae bacterium]
MRARRATRCVLGLPVVLAACAIPSASAHAATSATVTAALSPNRLSSNGALNITIGFSDPGESLPAPLRGATLRFPAGLTLEVPLLRSCSAPRLQALGANACPGASLLGRGRAVVAEFIGSQLVTENVSLRLFLGPLRNLQPTVVVFGEGLSPFAEQVVLDGLVFADAAPYGERLALTIPPIATVPQVPDASIPAFSLTVGANGRERRTRATVHVPAKCPAGGFALVSEFAYGDGSSDSVRATIPCPPSGHGPRER